MSRMSKPEENNSAEILNILAKSRTLLNFHQEMGLNYPRSGPIKKFMHQDAVRPGQIPLAVKRRAKPKPVPQPTVSLNDINTEITGCTRCYQQKNRLGIMPGQGKSKPALFIVSERLTREDIQTGQILSGEAGLLLDKMLSAINLNKNDVYLTPLVKCCPLDDKLPDPAEIKACLPFIGRQISALNPRIIYTLGQSAAQALLNTREPLLRLRGKFHQFNDILLLPSFHPSFLLKNPEMKKAAWHDLQMLERRLRI